MKKLLTACALITFGGIAAFADMSYKGTVTKDVRGEYTYTITTDNGQKVRVFIWEKDRILRRLIKNQSPATFECFTNPNDQVVVRSFTKN